MTAFFGSIAADKWSKQPLRPEQVVEGQPVTRCHTFGISPDGLFSFNLWDCTAGRLRWVYRSDEIIHILDGSATLQPEGGIARLVGPGDVAFFPRGVVVQWDIPQYVKKLAVCRSPPPEALPRRLMRAMWRLVR